MRTLSAEISHWASALSYEGLPGSVIDTTKLRVLDIIGLTIAGGETAFGRSVRGAGAALHAQGPATLFGTVETSTVIGAALVNGSLSQALEFDDTHNKSIVHMSGPAVVSSIALGESVKASGRDVIRAIAISNEISARVGSAAPGEFHKRGFHPTGLFTPFGVCWGASAMLGLSPEQMTHGAGIVGSFAAGLLECWVDGAQSKFLHPGWAAQGGISAAFLARSGATGPAAVLEGRFGLFASHLQSANGYDPASISADLGQVWESETASFKPFPVAHVIHPYIDAALALRAEHDIDPKKIAKIICPVAPYIVGIVCEPIEEIRRPLTDSHGRVSLQYTLAEAMILGVIDKRSYTPQSLADPSILALADKVEFEPDAAFPGPERFKGQVRVVMTDGSVHERVEEYNRGSPMNPMSGQDIVDKFTTNVDGVLSNAAAARLANAILSLEEVADIRSVTELTRASHD